MTMKFKNIFALQIGLCMFSVQGQESLITQQHTHQDQSSSSSIFQAMQQAIDQNNEADFIQQAEQYLATFGQLYKKQNGLFFWNKPVYVIASKVDANLAINPQHYSQFLTILKKAVHHDWHQPINMMLTNPTDQTQQPRQLTIDQIIQAIQQVPVTPEFSWVPVIAGTAVAAAAAGGLYYGYQWNNSPALPSQASTAKGDETKDEETALPITTDISSSFQTSDNIHLNQNMTSSENTLHVVPASNQNFVTESEFMTTPNMTNPVILATSASNEPETEPKQPFGARGLQRYLRDVASNPDFDNPSAPDTHVQPDTFDKAISPMTSTIDATDELLKLPGNAIRRLKNASDNLHNPEFKFGAATEKMFDHLEKSHENIGAEQNDNAYIAPDSGDYTLAKLGFDVGSLLGIYNVVKPSPKKSSAIVPVDLPTITSSPISASTTKQQLLQAPDAIPLLAAHPQPKLLSSGPSQKLLAANKSQPLLPAGNQAQLLQASPVQLRLPAPEQQYLLPAGTEQKLLTAPGKVSHLQAPAPQTLLPAGNQQKYLAAGEKREMLPAPQQQPAPAQLQTIPAKSQDQGISVKTKQQLLQAPNAIPLLAAHPQPKLLSSGPSQKLLAASKSQPLLPAGNQAQLLQASPVQLRLPAPEQQYLLPAGTEQKLLTAPEKVSSLPAPKPQTLLPTGNQQKYLSAGEKRELLPAPEQQPAPAQLQTMPAQSQNQEISVNWKEYFRWLERPAHPKTTGLSQKTTQEVKTAISPNWEQYYEYL